MHLVEVGIFSGGSLAMWQHYLDEQCHLGANCIVREVTLRFEWDGGVIPAYLDVYARAVRDCGGSR